MPVDPPARHHRRLRRVRAAALLVAGLLWAGPLAPPAPAAGPCEPGLVERVQGAYQAITSFRGQFRQTDVEPSGRRTEARGTIAYRRPGRMRWEYAPPHEQLLVTDGTTVWLHDPLLENVTVQPLDDVTRGTPLAFLLGVGSLADDFTCRAPTAPPPADGLRYLELVPVEPIPTLAFIQLGVEPASAAIRALRMVDGRGGSRVVLLEGLRTGVDFPEGHFTFQVTEGMEVITK